MDKSEIKKILEKIHEGSLSVEEGVRLLKHFPYKDIGIARIDTHRELRREFPEVILCRGKRKKDLYKIVESSLDQSGFLLMTKAAVESYELVRPLLKDHEHMYCEEAEIIKVGSFSGKITERHVAVISAGTSDIPIALEAAITAESLGSPVKKVFDIGVAGVHRVFDHLELLENAGAIVVVAGMEGALASIVGGLTSRPVIAVPTSVGYGASFEGLSALLGMLNSCVPGIVTVNIDNGFGAGYFAALINRDGINEGTRI